MEFLNENLLYTVAIFLIIFLSSRKSMGKLFEGEEIRKVGNFPVMVKFIPGDTNKSLVMIAPGANSTARVFYGVHEGYKPEDFIAYWLNKNGYNVLALSYPIGVEDPIFENDYPDFTLGEWGRQMAIISKEIIEENKLKNSVIAVGWSMAGRASHSLGEAADHAGLNIELWIGLAATPPFPGLSAPTIYPKIKKSDSDRGVFMVGRGGYAVFGNGSREVMSICENAKINKVTPDLLIPELEGRTHYFGNTPINLFNHGWRYRDGEFVKDLNEAMLDSKGYDYAGYPITANITNDSIDDARHAMTDRYNWGMVLTNKLTKSYVLPQMRRKKLTLKEWNEVKNLVRTAPDMLNIEMSGNHFFFIGEKGAKATAEGIKTLHERSVFLKRELGGILEMEIR